MTTRKPPPCTSLRPPHALTYARLYPSGWWCARHTPNGRPAPPPGPGWPSLRQPPAETDPEAAAPTSTEHDKEPTP
ncbi:hypothetical protein OG481_09660 [Streptomyces longwoodensis]|uniref:hypothetical protein n=1 Tax=Streptomyces longwoodensis TaxID=68231 RepID=UPI002DDA6A87|nr:hypothetical protein [Streptomyces longwoodensis]WRY88782.1 hypothetical protein OG481_09660 [Streptomyces longwoodensis]